MGERLISGGSGSFSGESGLVKLFGRIFAIICFFENSFFLASSFLAFENFFHVIIHFSSHFPLYYETFPTRPGVLTLLFLEQQPHN
jgi:hypothetical protein